MAKCFCVSWHGAGAGRGEQCYSAAQFQVGDIVASHQNFSVIGGHLYLQGLHNLMKSSPRKLLFIHMPFHIHKICGHTVCSKMVENWYQVYKCAICSHDL